MAIFDIYVKKLAEYVGEMREKERQVREIDCPMTVSKLVEGLPVQVGPQVSSGLVLRGDTFVELGNPEAGSCAFLLWTDNQSLIRDSKITLIGPDIQESPGASLPFGQVLMLGGVGLGEEEHEALERNQYVSDQIEGYMIRSVSQLMWSRVSKEAAGRGFCFETLGRALMAIFKSQIPKVQAVEIVFVTSGKEDLQPLDDISTQVRKIAKDIVRKNWKAKGIDAFECTLGWDCSSCPDKPVCDNIRELITVRKKKVSKSETSTKS
jgi:CO dehydrogenase/acetyl-CoA synthase beta subunit